MALLITALIVWLWLRTCASSKANVNNAPASSAANDAAAADKRAKDKAREDLSKAPKLDPKAKTKTVKKPVPEVEDYSLFQPDPVHTSLAIVYTTRKGDTLELVAKNVLGNSKRWSEIRDMNRLKIGPAYKLPPNRDIIVPLQ
ncbi:MAG: hypothetical protein HY042_00555 [Spirochaetia bacterium]|nr:hypothetical protein [Spirochaetia bacterium]